MDRRRRVLTGAGVCAFVVWAGADAPFGRAEAAPPPVRIGASIAARERATGTTSILITAEQLETIPASRSITEIIATLPTNRRVTPGRLPTGWRMEQRGRDVRTWGAATGEPYVRLDIDGNAMRDYVGREATIQFSMDEIRESPSTVVIRGWPKVSATSTLNGILTPPPQVSLDQPVFIGVADAYRRGKWEVVGRSATTSLEPIAALDYLIAMNGGPPSPLDGLLDAPTRQQLKAKSGAQPYVTRYTSSWGPSPRVRYTDPWGEITVDAPLAVQPVSPTPGERRLFSGSSMTFAGQAVCVNGRFPTPLDAYGLLLDGITELQPWAISPTTVMLGIPAAATPGPHTVEVPGGSSSVTVGVLTVEAQLDQNQLWRGQSTTMRLRVLGTDRRFPIAILNRTPEIVEMQGGPEQTVMTSGGGENAVTRNLKGVQRGDFSILYSVSAPGCGEGNAQ